MTRVLGFRCSPSTQRPRPCPPLKAQEVRLASGRDAGMAPEFTRTRVLKAWVRLHRDRKHVLLSFHDSRLNIY